MKFIIKIKIKNMINFLYRIQTVYYHILEIIPAWGTKIEGYF